MDETTHGLEDENPIRAIRVRLGLSLREASEDMGVHYQALYLNECSVYPCILPRVRDWCEKVWTVSSEELDRLYLVAQKKRRKASAEVIALADWSLDRLGPPGKNPVVALREQMGLSRMGFCKAFGIPSSLMYTVETAFDRAAVHLPERLVSLLREIGITEALLGELQSRYDDWYDENCRAA